MRIVNALGIATALAAAIGTVASTGPGLASPNPSATKVVAMQTCSVTKDWNTAPDGGGTAMSPAAILGVRAGRHACYDRLVFDIGGPDPVGFDARYVPVVRADGSGHPVPVPGAAALQLVVRAPIGEQPLRIGDPLVSPTAAGLRSVRAVAYAGSFEGQTTVGVGLSRKAPFRVWSLPDGDRQRVIVDVAR